MRSRTLVAVQEELKVHFLKFLSHSVILRRQTVVVLTPSSLSVASVAAAVVANGSVLVLVSVVIVPPPVHVLSYDRKEGDGVVKNSVETLLSPPILSSPTSPR